MDRLTVWMGLAGFLLLAFAKTGDAIRCWDCNSKFDPRCSYDNFNNHTLDALDCSQSTPQHLKGMEANYCRKIVQYIENEVRTIRGCGWYNDTRASQQGGCYSRTGTKNIMVYFCSCDTDGCNTAPGTAMVSLAAMATAAAVALLSSSF